MPAAGLRGCWRSLGMPPRELRLEYTLPTGQSFRWRKTGEDPLEYTGVVGRRVVVLQQSSTDVSYRVIGRGPGAAQAGDSLALEDYFHKPIGLSKLSDHWASRDERFRQLRPFVEGARMLRQDPLECLFSFICSSNNHISRIHGMVERLASNYGAPIEIAEEEAELGLQPEGFYSFPTLEQLSEVSEEALRADGYGYRAKYIVGAVKALQAYPQGGHEWLMGLRTVPFEEASAELQTLPGIGPKVAACVALFSLDKSDAIPVDTHVWDLALRYYCPHLKDKSLTPRSMKLLVQVHGEVQAAFKDVFGPHCGWAHNTLFISELPSIRSTLPEHLRPIQEAKPQKVKPAGKKNQATGSDTKEEAEAKESAKWQDGTVELNVRLPEAAKKRAARTRKPSQQNGGEPPAETPLGGGDGVGVAAAKPVDPIRGKRPPSALPGDAARLDRQKGISSWKRTKHSIR